MGNARGTCRAGRRTDTGLVGEQASLDSVHDRGAREAAEDRAEIKCISENVRKYGRNHRYVRHNHKQGHAQINHAHHRNQHRRHAGDLLSAAADTQKEHGRHQAAHDHRRQCRIVKSVDLKGVCNIKGSHQIEAHHVRENHDHRKQYAQPSLLQHRLDVVGGTAVAASVLSPFLINLRQRALDKGGGAP